MAAWLSLDLRSERAACVFYAALGLCTVRVSSLAAATTSPASAGLCLEAEHCDAACGAARAARPELKDRDFFVTGESYAGHYIPAFAHHLWRTNKAKPEGERIKLRGLAIGDGV